MHEGVSLVWQKTQLRYGMPLNTEWKQAVKRKHKEFYLPFLIDCVELADKLSQYNGMGDGVRSCNRILTRHKTAGVRVNSVCTLQTVQSLRIQPRHASITEVTVGKKQEL